MPVSIASSYPDSPYTTGGNSTKQSVISNEVQHRYHATERGGGHGAILSEKVPQRDTMLSPTFDPHFLLHLRHLLEELTRLERIFGRYIVGVARAVVQHGLGQGRRPLPWLLLCLTRCFRRHLSLKRCELMIRWKGLTTK